MATAIKASNAEPAKAAESGMPWSRIDPRRTVATAPTLMLTIFIKP